MRRPLPRHASVFQSCPTREVCEEDTGRFLAVTDKMSSLNIKLSCRPALADGKKPLMRLGPLVAPSIHPSRDSAAGRQHQTPVRMVS